MMSRHSKPLGFCQQDALSHRNVSMECFMSQQTSLPNCIAAETWSRLTVCVIIAASLFLAGCSERRSVAPPQAPSQNASAIGEGTTPVDGEPAPAADLP
jgi:hypothetical protein